MNFEDSREVEEEEIAVVPKQVGKGGKKKETAGKGKEVMRDDFEGMGLRDSDDDDDDDSISDGSFEFSDEEVGDGDIVFKDASIQKVWGGKAGGGSKTGAHGGGKKQGKAQEGAVGKGEGGMFAVPGWGEEEGKPKVVKHMTSKPNPFGKEAGVAEARKKEQQAERDRLAEEHKKAKEGRDAYFKGRKKDKQMHMKRTKTGQPVMSNMIKGMLAKLEKD